MKKVFVQIVNNAQFFSNYFCSKKFYAQIVNSCWPKLNSIFNW